MTVRSRTEGPSITPATVEALEATLPGPLPADYRDFLLARNGGKAEPNWWPPEQGTGVDVRAFLGLGDVSSHNDLVSTRKVFLGRIPEHLLSVAYSEGDAQICLALTGDDQGSIWVYDPEWEYDPADKPAPELLNPVCDSSTTLLETPEPEPEPGLDEMEQGIDAVAARQHDGA